MNKAKVDNIVSIWNKQAGDHIKAGIACPDMLGASLHAAAGSALTALAIYHQRVKELIKHSREAHNRDCMLRSSRN